MFKLTRESNFGHLTGNDRVEVCRGSYDKCIEKFLELRGKFNNLKVEAV